MELGDVVFGDKSSFSSVILFIHYNKVPTRMDLSLALGFLVLVVVCQQSAALCTQEGRSALKLNPPKMLKRAFLGYRKN